MNKTSAIEWLRKAWHNLSAAKVLYEVNHYSDVTAIELHYGVEKTLKSFLAYENKKIPKTHDLNEIHELIFSLIEFSDEDFELLDTITEYHIEESYPAFDRLLPSKSEIKKILEFAEELFDNVCKILNINKEEIINE